jgi:hypothetical protein
MSFSSVIMWLFFLVLLFGPGLFLYILVVRALLKYLRKP